ncbi:copper chaperone PCu(A)C [Nevskia ramosa]|uniref:copper chaperone PCu(A)C n=1 Tax=Nevskia ramosa TaxID=64002 RepID=UPI0003B791B7|nr:copper chaperone PCu(A)C [Nevskia ramosa]
MPSRLTAACLAFATLLPFAASAHDYTTGKMKVLHPWTDPTPAGTASAPLRLRIVEIQADDRLLAAETPVAARIEVIPAAGDAEPGIALINGQDLKLGDEDARGGARLRLHGINTQLFFGREYPLNLHFAKAGMVEAGLIISDPE